jgi:DNA polymerase I-like protein with 3'-5' exonuclease and polymerase domains
VQVYDGKQSWIYLHTHGIVNNEYLKALFADPDIIKIAHNAEFEMLWIKQHCGIDLVNVYDTQLAEQILSAGKELPCALRDVIARRIGVEIPKETRNEFIDHPGFHVRAVTNEQVDYMERDVKYLPAIREQQLEEISKAAMGKALALELLVLPVIVNLRYHGLKFDIVGWEEVRKQIETKVQEIELQVRAALAGIPMFMAKTKNHTRTVKAEDGSKTKETWVEEFEVELTAEEINLGSTKQLLIAFAALDIPLTSTGEQVLADWMGRSDDERANHFLTLLLDWREWNKRLTWDYPKYINSVTGKIHPEWRQMGADTGRLSCRAPNLQNVPRPNGSGPNLRKLWVPDEDDYMIICADYSQQEPRVLAQLCRDPGMIAACNQKDVYIEFAKHMYGRTVEKGSDERQIAKQFVLAVGYGAGPDKLHRTSKLPLDECKRIRDIIRATFPGVVVWGQTQLRHLQQYGYTTTLTGRRRYFPDVNQRRYTTAVNTPVQGTSADMMKLALIKVNSFLTSRQFRARIWLTVHDELEVMVHRDDVNELLPHVLTLMEEAGSQLCPDVTHIAEARVFPTWDK